MNLLDKYNKFGTNLCVHSPVRARRCGRDTDKGSSLCGAAVAAVWRYWNTVPEVSAFVKGLFNLYDASEGVQRLKCVLGLTRLLKT